MKNAIVLILSIILLQSCYFGMFLVEENLPGNYYLSAENELEQLKITHSPKNTSGYNIIVKETVFAVGFNKDFIIAKNYSKDNKKVRYHIIEVKNNSSEESVGLSFEDYKLKREKLNLPYDLNFTLVYHEVAKN